jgi:predicted CXXCH cytochrome family protein
VRVALLVAVLGAGCMSPERRYRVLTFLFDGVPPPGQVAAVEEPKRLAAGERRVARRARRPVPIFIRHEAECEECHSRDRAPNRLAAPRQELCWDCHDREEFEGEVVHGPVAAGECVECHSPHKSKFPSLLLSKGSSICAKCHDRRTFPSVDQHRVERGDECLDCHDPHAGDRDYMLYEGKGAS